MSINVEGVKVSASKESSVFYEKVVDLLKEELSSLISVERFEQMRSALLTATAQVFQIELQMDAMNPEPFGKEKLFELYKAMLDHNIGYAITNPLFGVGEKIHANSPIMSQKIPTQ